MHASPVTYGKVMVNVEVFLKVKGHYQGRMFKFFGTFRKVLS